MIQKEPIEILLHKVTLKPPNPRLKQAVFHAVKRAEVPYEATCCRLSPYWWGGIAACLAMVLLTHWLCESQLRRWTRPPHAQPLSLRDPAVFEDLGWGIEPEHLARFSRTSVPGGRSEVRDYMNHMRQLLEESRPPALKESQGDLPKGQSHNTLLQYNSPNAQIS